MRDLLGLALPEAARGLVQALPDLRLRKKSVELAGDGILWLNCCLLAPMAIRNEARLPLPDQRSPVEDK